MVRAAAHLIRTKGVSGTGLREVVAEADAPRGSLQHYFPEGKDQLVSEALLWMGGVAGRRVDRLLTSEDNLTPSGLFAGMVDLWRREFREVGFEGGCPLVAATADMAATNESLRRVTSEAFAAWLERLTSALVHVGVGAERAGGLATLLLSALEGAIVLSRIRRDTSPLDTVVSELSPLLDAAAQ
jgi:AcrR family transcriptional regulator